MRRTAALNLSMTPATHRRVSPLSKDQLDELMVWRAEALELMPYFARILYAFRPLDAPGLGTFACDPGYRLYVDFAAVSPKGVRWCAEALLHECGHMYNDHAGRSTEHGVLPDERFLWNLACFPPGTLLPSGKRIETVATIVNPFDGELVVVTTQAGTVVATPDHPFFARRRRHKRGLHPIVLNDSEWVPAGDLTDDHYICVPRLDDKRSDTEIDLTGHAITHTRAGTTKPDISHRTVRTIPLDRDVAWLIGLYVAEGSSSSHVRFSLGASEDGLMKRIEEIAKRLGWSASRSYSTRDASCAMNLGTTVFGRWLKANCGDRAAAKHVPDVILRHSDPYIRRAFLQGLVDGDGHERVYEENGSRRWTVATSSEALMRDVVLLLAQDGIGAHTRIEAQRPRSIGGVVLPAGWLYYTTWSPDGPQVATKMMNGRLVVGSNHRWKADDDGVWYPIRAISSRPYSGLVYNLTTESHTYVASSYLVHNCDAEINDDLVATGCESIADSGVLPSHLEMPAHLLAEQYMDALRRQRPPSSPAGGGTGQGQQEAPGGQQPFGDGADDPPFGGCGSASGGEAAPCEIAPDDDAGGAAPAASETEKKIVQIATAAAVREHAAKHPGSTPAGLVERAEMILAPSKLPWRQILASSVRRAAAMRVGVHDTTYLRPNRRRGRIEVAPGRRAVYPGSYSPDPSIVVVRDTSGSMGADELQMVTVEVEGIARQLGVRGEALRVLDVDTEVNSVRGYGGISSLEEVAGRGGTDMGAGITYAAALRPRPTTIVVVTDGYTPWPVSKPRVPVVVCIVGRGDLSRVVEAAPEWATVVAVDPDEDTGKG